LEPTAAPSLSPSLHGLPTSHLGLASGGDGSSYSGSCCGDSSCGVLAGGHSSSSFGSFSMPITPLSRQSSDSIARQLAGSLQTVPSLHTSLLARQSSLSHTRELSSLSQFSLGDSLDLELWEEMDLGERTSDVAMCA
jgi:hypothetical protein